jgi:2,3-bisphosphoglycerate-dependent phosphoglycerate mutase
MTDILLIRHGETAWNRVRRMQGHIDIALNDEGYQQARSLARALQSEPPAAIYASDLQRAHATALAVADLHQLPVHRDVALRERCYGAFEGLLYEEISLHHPEAFALWQSRDPQARFPAGEREAETLEEFHQRSINVVTRIANQHPDQRIVIVTHGGVLDCLYRAAHDLPMTSPRDFAILNAAINRLHWDEHTFVVLQWADATHLEADGLDEIDRSHPAA